MTLERAFQLSSILLSAVGFSGLVLTGEIPAGLVLIGGGALAASMAHAVGLSGGGFIGRLTALPGSVWTVLLIAVFLSFGIDLLLVSRDIMPASIHFLILLMVIKVFHLRHRKDFLQLYAISLLELLAAAALTVDLWYAAIFIAYVFAAIWTLILYHLRNESEEASAEAGPAPADPALTTRPVTGQFFWTTNAIAVGSFCLTLLIFFMIPRIGAGFFQKNRTELIRTSGFSEKVDLGVIGAVKLDPTVVMRVELPDHRGAVQEGLYFRGVAYDTYDGRSWSNHMSTRLLLERNADGLIPVPSAQSVSGGDREGLRQEILIEALDTTVLFGASFVDSIKGGMPFVQMDGMRALYLSYPMSSRFQYSVRSVSGGVVTADRMAESIAYPETIRQHFLQLPRLGARVADLAREVTGASPTTYAKAAAIERHLRRSYQYSLDVGPTVSDSPVEDFLFTRKTGYCEHYATAMVVMLRTVGIPARLVTGFLPGVWNDFGNYYSVRQQDAHAWVEVYFPRSGWVTFDPTPSVPATAPPIFWKVGKVVDSIRLKWDRYVIQYSFRDQMAVAKSLREGSEKVRSEFSELTARSTRWLASVKASIAQAAREHGGWIAGILLGGVLAALLFAWLRRRSAKKDRRVDPRTARQKAATHLYGRMLRVLASQGIHKPSGTTALEFARRVDREWTEAGPYVAPLTEFYCTMRFGHTALSLDEGQKADELLAALAATKRS